MKHGDHAETLSQDDLRVIFKNEKKAVAWLEAIRWGKAGITCTRCGSFENVKPRVGKKENPLGF